MVKILNTILAILFIFSFLLCFTWVYSLEQNLKILKNQVEMYEIQDYKKECELEKDIRLIQQDIYILENGYDE